MGKVNESNYDGNCTSRDFQSGTYVISGRLIFVEQSVHSVTQSLISLQGTTYVNRLTSLIFIFLRQQDVPKSSNKINRIEIQSIIKIILS
jgi:hypothetical protein